MKVQDKVYILLYIFQDQEQIRILMFSSVIRLNDNIIFLPSKFV
jgi:hypothetical protein